MSDVTSLPVSQRARCLSEGLHSVDGEVVASFVEFLAAGGVLEAAQLDARARNWAGRLTG
jgi:hypothetical protein